MSEALDLGPLVLPEDQELLARVTACDTCPALADCSEPILREIGLRYGLDFATALLYDRVRRHAAHAHFLQQVQQNIQPLGGTPLIGIIPGAFYRQHKNTGADGRHIFEVAPSIKARAELIPVPSFGPLRENARHILDWLSRQKEGPILLVSLSKGSADLKTALAIPGATQMFRSVAAWVSLSGLPQGTPLVDWLRRQTLRRLGARLLLRLRGQSYSVIEELVHTPDGPLATWPLIPSHLQMIHVVAFPLRRHLAHPWAHRGYERVAPYGPNDGGGFLLAGVSRLPGFVFPVWGADHYLQPAWDITSLVRGVLTAALTLGAALRQATRSDNQPSMPPAIKSTA